MERLAFHLFVVGSYFCCALMTVVVHSFAADSRQTDPNCCDLVGFFLLFFFYLMFAGRQPFGGFEVVSAVFFHLVSAVCLTD